MVDLIVRERNLGYHEENWKARMHSSVISGKIEGSFINEGMRALYRDVISESDSALARAGIF